MLRRLLLVLSSIVLVLGCGPSTPAPSTGAPKDTVQLVAAPPAETPPTSTVTAAATPRLVVAPGDPVKVTGDDAMIGPPDAPVTIVEFGDLECPYTKKLHGTLQQILKENGTNVRWVFKHVPMPFHESATRAAELASALRALGGDGAAFAFFDAVFAADWPEKEARRAFYENIALRVARRAGISPDALLHDASHDAVARVEADAELARSIGARATPTTFVNGTKVVGAQAIDKLQAMIDTELPAARLALERGTPRSEIYAARVAVNFPQNAPDKTAPDPLADTTVWKIPVGKSPVRGNAKALVTIVELTDYQCPFCSKVQPTLKDVAAKYGDKVRFVYKSQPLPFHPQARPAAELAMEVYKRKGAAAFWQAHEALFAAQRVLDDALFEKIATDAKLDPRSTLAAIKRNANKAAIDADMEMADDFNATGTPSFFVNGRRLTGAHSLEVFSKLIDQELAKAQELVDAGTPAASVYEATMRKATPAPPVERKKIPAPTKASPSKGKGPLVIQVFSDFQCPFCKKLTPTLSDLEKELGTQVRIVFRNRPLPMHKDARRAAAAALEVRAQLGDDAFWKYHDALFDRQSELANAIVDEAVKLGADRQKLEAALASNVHEAAIAADEKIANDAGISGTPGTVVGDVFVSGAQSIAKFRRAARVARQKPKK